MPGGRWQRYKAATAHDRAEQLALKLMGDWGLVAQGWRFEWMNRKRTLGLCRHLAGRPGIIFLSRAFVALATDDDVRDTVLHEIAHALAGPHAGHGPRWKAWCLKVGARPVQCSDGKVMAAAAPWRADCPCGVSYSRYRAPRDGDRFACSKCRSPITFARQSP